MLTIGKANEVRFKVDVNGTSASPDVRVILSTADGDIGFKAEKDKQLAGYFFSEVKIPEDLTAGEYDLRVEVVLNNRLFTPLKRRITIGEAPVVYAAPAAPAPAHPTQTPDQTQTWEDEGGSLPEAPEKPIPIPPETIPKPVPVSPPVPPVEESLKLMKAFDVPKKAAAPTKLPTPARKVERIKIAEIAQESSRKFDKVLSESPSYRKPGKAVTPISIKPHTPVTLKKGEVVYE